VRTPPAAQTVVSCATRLGLSAQVRTALSETDVMARLAERPADVILADTALTRPDTVGFTRRVLARSPGTVLVLFGAEDPRVAAAAVAAGARALIRGTEDLVSTVAKAVLLLGIPVRPAGAPAGAPRTAQPANSAVRGANAPGRFGTQPAGPGRNPGPSAGAEPEVAAHDALSDGRADLFGEGGPGSGSPAPVGAGGAVPVGGRGLPPTVPAQRGDFGDITEAAGRPVRPNGEPGLSHPVSGPAVRRVVLTERELQVLRGMADGKSNAEIGRELFVSEDTVKTHARRLFRKLGARDRAHAVAAGFRAGLVA
jgi:DNA-binding NarL/FixJ family response regulator